MLDPLRFALESTDAAGESVLGEAFVERIRDQMIASNGLEYPQPVGTFMLTAFATTFISLTVAAFFLGHLFVNAIRRSMKMVDKHLFEISSAAFTVSVLLAYLSALFVNAALGAL